MLLSNFQWNILWDTWSQLFLFLIAGIGLLVLFYAFHYFHQKEDRKKFFPTILLFAASMIGVVTLDNLILVFIFWELTSITSYFLIAFDPEDPKARKSALHALLITGGGGLAFLAAIVILYQITGTLSISETLARSNEITLSPLFDSVVILIILGAFTKSAIFPFHFWLPGAMTAPTPVSTYLHSATMVKAGVYLLYRLSPLCSNWPYWKVVLLSFGLFTFIMMAFRSCFQKDLKSIVAFTTTSALGLMVALIGWNTEESFKILFLFVIAHALYKASLFFLVGHLDHQTGTKYTNEIHGLGKQMPYAQKISFIALLSVLGAGPFLSFVSKEMLLVEFPIHLNAIVVFGLLFSNIASLEITLKPFRGEISSHPNSKENFKLLLPPLILILMNLLLGLFIYPFSSLFLGFESSLWHGFNFALLTSILLIAFTFLSLNLKRIKSIFNINESQMFENLWNSHLRLAEKWTLFTQNGSLAFYIGLTVLSSCILIFYSKNNFEVPDSSPLHLIGLAIGFIVFLATFILVKEKRVFPLALGLGLIGSAVALFFTYYGALDLAMTQLSVEALSILFFVLVLRRVPHIFKTQSEKVYSPIPFFRVGLSLFAGFTIFLVLWTSSSSPAPSHLRSFFGENSLTQGFGANVVNVILVDFRALDTMGEITVLAIAAMGIWWILTRKEA